AEKSCPLLSIYSLQCGGLVLGLVQRLTPNPRPLNWYPYFNNRSAAARSLQPRELSSNQASAVSHVLNPSRAPEIARCGHPAAVVAHPDQQVLAFAHTNQLTEAGARVLRDVVEVLLYDSIQQQLFGLGKIDIVAASQA